jgi:hypothetical protein
MDIERESETEMSILDRLGIGEKSIQTKLKEAEAAVAKADKAVADWETRQRQNVDDKVANRKSIDEIVKRTFEQVSSAIGDATVELPDVSEETAPLHKKQAKLDADGKLIDRMLTLAKQARTPLKAALVETATAHSDYLYATEAREMQRLLAQLLPINKKLATLRQKHHPDLLLPWLNDEMFAGWTFGFKTFADPQPKPKPDPNTVITFIRDYSPGGLSGKLYTQGDGAAFPAETAARIVAGKFAVWQRPTTENEELTEAARRGLVAIDPTALAVELGQRE